MTTNINKQALADKFTTAFNKDNDLVFSAFATKHKTPDSTLRRIIEEYAPHTYSQYTAHNKAKVDLRNELQIKVIPYLMQHGIHETEAKFNLTSTQISRILSKHNQKVAKADRKDLGQLKTDLILRLYLDDNMTMPEIALKLQETRSTVWYHLNRDSHPESIQKRITAKKQNNLQNARKNNSLKTKQSTLKAQSTAATYLESFVRNNPDFSYSIINSRIGRELVLTMPDGQNILLRLRATTKENGEIRGINPIANYGDYFCVYLLGMVLTEKTPEVYLVPFSKVYGKKTYCLRSNNMPGPNRANKESFETQILAKIEALN